MNSNHAEKAADLFIPFDANIHKPGFHWAQMRSIGGDAFVVHVNHWPEGVFVAWMSATTHPQAVDRFLFGPRIPSAEELIASDQSRYVEAVCACGDHYNAACWNKGKCANCTMMGNEAEDMNAAYGDFIKAEIKGMLEANGVDTTHIPPYCYVEALVVAVLKCPAKAELAELRRKADALDQIKRFIGDSGDWADCDSGLMAKYIRDFIVENNA